MLFLYVLFCILWQLQCISLTVVHFMLSLVCRTRLFSSSNNSSMHDVNYIFLCEPESASCSATSLAVTGESAGTRTISRTGFDVALPGGTGHLATHANPVLKSTGCDASRQHCRNGTQKLSR